MARELSVEWLGRVSYAEGLEQQQKRLDAVRAGAAPDALLLLEHPPVVTLGRSAREENLRWSRGELAARGVDCFSVARGGDVTYHAPGQLVGYAILDLAARGEADVHAHLRALEAVLVEALEALGVAVGVREGFTGVYARTAPGETPRKLASIGVGLRGWVTWHGFALNVDLDLAGFDAIVPCGLHDVAMSSVAAELGAAVPADLFPRARAAVERAAHGRWS